MPASSRLLSFKNFHKEQAKMEKFRKTMLFTIFCKFLFLQMHLVQGQIPLSATTATKVVTSPSYPQNYANSLDLTWEIRSAPGARVLLTITDLATEECCDSVQILENGVVVGTYQGTSQIEIPYISSGSQVTLKFQSDFSSVEKGFRATYKAVRACRSTLTAQSTAGTFTSPNYPGYPANSDCFWEISTATTGRHVELTIEAGGATQSPNDYVSVYEGQQRFVQLHGNINEEAMATSSGEKLFVYFHSDATVSGRGFRASYRQIQCGETIQITDTNQHVLTSPGYPFKSSNDLRCMYTLQAQPGRTVEVTIDVDTEECCDTLEIFDGQTSLGQLQGKRENAVFRSTGNTLGLLYVTDESFTEPGFRARYRQMGGGGDDLDLSGHSECSGTGDPHYTTFDGKRFDFHGTCSYILTEYSSKNGGKGKLKPFRVEVFQEHRGTNTQVAYIHKVQITVGKVTFQLCQNKKLKVKIDAGQFVAKHTPYTKGDLKVDLSGNALKFKGGLGLEVKYSVPFNVYAKLSNRYSNQVTGLCANMNGDANDDFPLNNFVPARNRFFLDTSYVGDLTTNSKQPSVNCNPDVPPVGCSRQDKIKYSAECSLLTNRNDPAFSDCIPHVDPTTFFEDCVFDACANMDAYQAISDIFLAYTVKCKAEPGVTVGNWKQALGMEPVCKANSHYELCGPACPATCAERNPMACPGFDEGCFCDDGFVLSGDKCVPVADCGCMLDGEYYKNNQVFYTDSNCVTKCICKKGLLQCKASPCSNKEMCGISKKTGLYACVPRSTGTASCSGDPHYSTFDRRYFDFMGVGTFTMVQTDGFPMSDEKWIRIAVENERRGSNTRVSYVKAVIVTLEKGQTVVRMDKDNVIRLNGQVIQGYDSDSFKIHTTKWSTILTTEFFVTVTFSYNSALRVDLPSTYSGEISGLFGNFNGNSNDDLPQGKSVRNINEFARQFEVGPIRAIYPTSAFTCALKLRRQWSGAAFCGRLTSPGGPFSQCHRLVNPSTYFNDCVFDVCANNGDRATLERSLEEYALACQTAGIKVCNWRAATGFTNTQCPTNSRYEGCASPCADTCADPFASNDCELEGTVEDCVCNPGFVKDGDKCIRPSQCGIVDDTGIYTSPQTALSCSFAVQASEAHLTTFNNTVLALFPNRGSLQIQPRLRSLSVRAKRQANTFREAFQPDREVFPATRHPPISVGPITQLPPLRTQICAANLVNIKKRGGSFSVSATSMEKIVRLVIAVLALFPNRGSLQIQSRLRSLSARAKRQAELFREVLEPEITGGGGGGFPVTRHPPISVGPITKLPPLRSQICAANLVNIKKRGASFSVSVENHVSTQFLAEELLDLRKVLISHKKTTVQIIHLAQRVRVNSRTVVLPYVNRAQGINIIRNATNFAVRTDDDIKVFYNFRTNEVIVSVPNNDNHSRSGLCALGGRDVPQTDLISSQFGSIPCRSEA